ncbi:uncharacterized protein [Diadema antillarum]|uniref:uncharacterized protein n=1 Tax=Diadema antillarum TaxID=105358 RepID=UPI003A852CED
MNPTYVPTAADECRAFEEKDEEEQYQTVEQYQRVGNADNYDNYDDVEQDDGKGDGETYEELGNVEEPPGYQGVIERPLPIPEETIKSVDDDEVIYEDPTSEYTTMIHEAQIAPNQGF